MLRKRNSAVWEFFDEPVVVAEHDEKGGKQVKNVPCKLCDQKHADGGGTTNLMNHLKLKHPEQYERAHSSDRSRSKQSTLTGGMLRKCSAQRAAAITDLIAEFVAQDLRPLRRGFQAADGLH